MGADYFQYHKVIDYYSGLYGKENVHVFLYEEFRESNIRFIASFSKRLELSIDENLISYERVNEGYRSLLIVLRKFFNAFTRKGPLNKYYLLNLPYFDRFIRFVFAKANKSRIFGKRIKTEKILGRENVKDLREYYRQSNQILVEKYGLIDIVKYHYPL